MRFYRLDFLSAPAVEGDEFEYKSTSPCNVCGLRSHPYASDFVVSDDRVSRLDFLLLEKVDQPLLEVAGVLVAEEEIAVQMAEAGITGFTLGDATAALPDEIDSRLPSYKWLKITGRCKTNDVWSRVVSVCSECGSARTEPVVSPIRRVVLETPAPKCDLNRSREPTSGIIASDRFVDLLDRICPEHKTFLKLIEPQTA
jgi:hypothetical protein